jgi:hypothetical protein
MVDFEKRRRDPKLSERFAVSVLTQDGEASGETRSLTVEGVFFYCPERLREGQLCRMKIDLPLKPIELTGRLTWSNQDNFNPEHTIPGMGFCFVKMSGKDRDRLLDAIDAYHGEKKRSSAPS